MDTERTPECNTDVKEEPVEMKQDQVESKPELIPVPEV